MTKLKAIPGMQIYLPGAVSQWTEKPLILRRGPAWMGRVENLSGPQLKAAYALAKAAYEFAYGKKGKVRYKGKNLPIGAFIVAQAVPKGAGVHGGKTRAERAEERHAAAAATLAYLESLIREKGETVPTISRPAGV